MRVINMVAALAFMVFVVSAADVNMTDTVDIIRGMRHNAAMAGLPFSVNSSTMSEGRKSLIRQSLTTAIGEAGISEEEMRAADLALERKYKRGNNFTTNVEMRNVQLVCDNSPEDFIYGGVTYDVQLISCYGDYCILPTTSVGHALALELGNDWASGFSGGAATVAAGPMTGFEEPAWFGSYNNVQLHDRINVIGPTTAGFVRLANGVAMKKIRRVGNVASGYKFRVGVYAGGVTTYMFLTYTFSLT